MYRFQRMNLYLDYKHRVKPYANLFIPFGEKTLCFLKFIIYSTSFFYLLSLLFYLFSEFTFPFSLFYTRHSSRVTSYFFLNPNLCILYPLFSQSHSLSLTQSFFLCVFPLLRYILFPKSESIEKGSKINCLPCEF